MTCLDGIDSLHHWCPLTKEDEILAFLSKNVFEPILASKSTSKELKAGVSLTIARMKKLKAQSMVQYFWSAIMGTPRSIEFAKRLKQDGFRRFEDVIDEFREKFNPDQWLTSGKIQSGRAKDIKKTKS